METLKRMQLAVLVALMLSYAKAEYDLHIRLYGYSNPTNRCPLCRQNPLLPPGCCDNHSNLGSCQGDERCDNAFFYCLKQLNSPPDSDPAATTLCGFQNNEGRISHINPNGEPIDFSRDRVLDIPNPFTLPGISPQWQGVQLYVEVADISGEHHSSNQIVDTFSINLNTSSIGIFSSPAWYNGTFGFASLQLSYKVECSVSYYTNCDTSCVTNRDCTCIPGFVGVACQNNVNECSEAVCPENSECVDGVNAFSCNCLPGYSKVGDDCVTTSTDSDHMTTTTKDVITTADHMTTATSHMTTHMTTQEDFTTTSTDHMDVTTEAPPRCGPGLTDLTCKVVPDNCTEANCTENGLCVGDRCDCHPGYTGTRCEINIDECEGVTCSGKGVCVDGVNQYMCDCQDGSSGQNCELGNNCAGVECSGHGRCRLEDEAEFSCVCDQGYTGQLCEVQDCTVSNCSSHTQHCGEDSRCVCRSEYTGARCETLVGCLGVDCSGSGTCVQRGDGLYGCDCHAGFTGESCDKTANLTGSSGDAGPPPVTYLLPVGLLIAILILLAIIVAAVLLTRIYLHKHQHVYEDVIPGSAKIIAHLNESYNSTGVIPKPTAPSEPNHAPQQANPPQSVQGSGTKQTHMPSHARHMSLPASQRPNYENRVAIRSHRLSMIPRQEASWSRPGPEHRALPYTAPVRETPFTRDSGLRPVLEHESQPRTKPDRSLNNTTSNASRRHRSHSQTWLGRGDSSLHPQRNAKTQRALSLQNWSKQDAPTMPKDHTPKAQSWRGQTVSHFTPRLSPIAGVGTVEEEQEYENQDTLNSSGGCYTEEFSSSEYVNFSPSMTPDPHTTEEPVLECQPYLYCQPSNSQLGYHHYDMEEGGEQVEVEGGEKVEVDDAFAAEKSLEDSFEDSFDTDNSFETVSEADKDESTCSAARDTCLYEADSHLYEVDSHLYNFDSQLSVSDSDSHTYERIPE